MTASQLLPPHADAFFAALGAGPLEAMGDETWWFEWAHADGIVAVSPEGSIEFELVLAEDAEPDELREWLAAQPAEVREGLDIQHDDDLARLTFQGAVDPDMDLDVVDRVGRMLKGIADACARRVQLVAVHDTERVHRPARDPMSLPVANAWLVYGSEASMPTAEGLAEQQADAERGEYRWSWTVNKATRAGDLLLFYFLSPDKTLRYVARAASDAFFEKAASGADQQCYGPAQWWAYITPLTPIPEVGINDVTDILEQPVLRGGSGKYCKPEGIERLRQWLRAHHPNVDLAAELPVPLGNPQLPHPATMTVEEWRSLAAGALYPEKVVETHVVEPLVRFILEGVGPGYELRGQHRLGRMKPDHLLLKDGQPQLVIETKVAVRRPRASQWLDSPDFRQVAEYARRLGTRAALIDAGSIYLLSEDLTGVDRIIDRPHLAEEELALLREFLTTRDEHEFDAC